jgi:two-component system, sensor histidine kinase LadS
VKSKSFKTIQVNIQRFLLFLCLLAGWPCSLAAAGPAAAAPLISLHPDLPAYTIGNQVALLEDPSGELTLPQVQQLASSFKLSRQEAPVYGPTSSAIWCRFRVHNASPETQWYLEVGSAYLYEIDLYRQTGPGAFEKIKAGTSQPFALRPVPTNRLILPIPLASGSETTFYMRFRTRSIMRFPMQIATMAALYRQNHHLDVANGIYFGFMFSLIIYNLFVFFSLRDKAYLYYILYVLALSLDVACIRGYLLEWIPASWSWLVTTRFFPGITMLFALLFTNAFLLVPRYLPRLYAWRWVILGLIALIYLLNLLELYVWGFTCMLLTFIPGYVYIYTAGISVYRKGFLPARYYTLAFAFLGVGISIYILKDNNVLPENAFTESSLQLGAILEAVILSFALASKFNYFKREKEQAQALAIRQANAFSQQLIQSQEHERKRIAAELHDSVGQSLILIKNKILLLQKRVGEPEKVYRHAEDLTGTVANTIHEVRTISYALRPFQLDMLGLTHSIQSLAEEAAEASGIRIEVEADSIDSFFPKSEEINLYRIVQESLNNIIKHSGATKARLTLSREEQVVQLKIEDNGKGMRPNGASTATKQGFGLLGIQERINILAGNWLIKDAVPHGTIIHISIPIAETYANA